jgi:hypoxanthine phosphoribosyltransferase
MQYLLVSQDEVDTYIYQLIHLVRWCKPNAIVGICNGGLHVSYPIAEFFNIPHFNLHINLYNNQVKRNAPIINESDIATIQPITGNLLIVDDLVDGGTTMALAVKHLTAPNKRLITAVLYWNKSGCIKPNFYVVEKPNAWLVFPWEKI